MAEKLNFKIPKIKLNKRRVVFAALILLFVYMVMDLNSRLAELERLTEQRDQLATQAFAITKTEMAIKTQVAYASSGDAVEDYAESRRMVDDDNTVIIVPLPDNSITPTPRINPTPTPFVYEKKDVWKELFFGD